MGSFRPAAGNAHLHACYNFTESLAETATKSLRHSCGSELTRQGISLESLLNVMLSGCCHPCMSPCSRDHIFTRCLGVWRMASEDSDQFRPGFLAVHRLNDLHNRYQSFRSQMIVC